MDACQAPSRCDNVASILTRLLTSTRSALLAPSGELTTTAVTLYRWPRDSAPRVDLTRRGRRPSGITDVGQESMQQSLGTLFCQILSLDRSF